MIRMPRMLAIALTFIVLAGSVVTAGAAVRITRIEVVGEVVNPIKVEHGEIELTLWPNSELRFVPSIQNISPVGPVRVDLDVTVEPPGILSVTHPDGIAIASGATWRPPIVIFTPNDAPVGTYRIHVDIDR